MWSIVFKNNNYVIISFGKDQIYKTTIMKQCIEFWNIQINEFFCMYN